jgi:RNA polymerase sigma factor (sigma-70 family)
VGRKTKRRSPSTVQRAGEREQSESVNDSDRAQLNTAQLTDDELVAAAQLALPAFEHLYKRYVNDVYRFCLHRLGNDADAADATSVIFTRALTNIHTCHGSSFRPWLFAIARNVVIDHFRSARPIAVLDESLEIADATSGPEELAIAGDERRRLASVLARLTDEQRSIIELRLAGLNATEIASALGKSRNAIDQMQFRAVARLRTLLAAPVMQLEEPRL